MVRKLAFESLEERIKDFEKDKKNKNFADLLIESYMERDTSDPNSITKEEIVHEFLTFYFAGMEATANLAAKMVYQ